MAITRTDVPALGIAGTEVISSARAATFVTLAVSGTSVLTGTLQVNAAAGIGVAPLAWQGLQVRQSLSGGVNQYGIVSAATASSAATGEAVGVYGRIDTAAAVFTLAQAASLRAANPVKGSGSTITTSYGVYVESITAGATNYAIYTNTGWVRFGDTVLTIASTTSRSGLRLPHGAAPTTPVNGDIWTTSAGLFVRVNGATVGPLS